MLYNVVLFLHILGVVIMFMAVGVTLSAMIAMLHSKTVETLRSWSKVAVKVDGLLPLSVILILLPGVYLVFSRWGWRMAWVNVSLVTLIVMTFMGPAINLRRLKEILNTAMDTTDSVPTVELLEKVRDRILWNSISIMTMLAIAILFLMTVKLGMIGSLITIGAAISLGPIIAKAVLNGAAESISDSSKSPSNF
ncbi:hypothetical protein [Halobacillus ihumii]|uniref:hypothetical protein n=1 Tax=Halobacillus ihumii TaxID=2686092 RepID=UPI0013D58316|nr:hypothetical protein [Halobacillus ihumii]